MKLHLFSVDTPFVMLIVLSLLPSPSVGQGCEPILLQRLYASDGGTGDAFGCSASISNNVIVIGAYNASPWYWRHTSDNAYTYRRLDDSWVEEARLDYGYLDTGDWFGRSVSVCDDFVLTGAPGHDVPVSDAGIAFLYEWTGTEWLLSSTLHAFADVSGLRFGNPVCLASSVAAVGALGQDAGPDGSYVYLFNKRDGQWVEGAKLQAADVTSGDGFGYALSLSDSLLAVGAPYDDDLGPDSGSVYVFRWNGSEWEEEAKLLVLQLRLIVWRSCAVMVTACDGLMTSSPDGPGQRALLIAQTWPDDGDQQPTHFRLGQWDQRSSPFLPG